MKEVILKRIVIDHWRGQSLDVPFLGNTCIYGRNKMGKSTIFNAFLWTLTGADAQDRANFQLFDNRLPMTFENAFPAKVDVYLEIDGNDYKFSRVAKQSWSRPRGKSEYIKDASDKYSFFIDDIEIGSGEYKKRVEEMFAPTDMLKIILNIKQMYSLDWKAQREAFSVISGEISEADFKGDYTDLLKELKKYSIDELEARIKTICAPLKASLDSLPETIKTLEANLPDISTLEDVKIRIKESEEEIKKIDEKFRGISDTIKPFIDKRKEEQKAIDLMTSEMNSARNRVNEEQRRLPYQLKEKRATIIRDNERIEYDNTSKDRKRGEIKGDIERLRQQVEECVGRREKLIKERDIVVNRKFDSEICSYCGQMLPDDKLEKLKADFLKQQADDKADVVKRGKENNAHKERLLKRIEELEEELKSIPANQDLESLEEVDKEITEAEAKVVSFEDSETYNTYVGRIKEMEANMTSIPEYDTDALSSMKDTLMAQIKEDSELLGLEKERKKQEEKIESYKKQLRDNSNEMAVQERLSMQLKAYKQEYADLVSEKVNTLFERVKVEMMQQNKSGAWVPSCSISTDGVLSHVYNKAESILSGIDISNAFMKYFGLNMPLFIDDAESISSNNSITSERQLIRLIVSDDDKIRVEHE